MPKQDHNSKNRLRKTRDLQSSVLIEFGLTVWPLHVSLKHETHMRLAAAIAESYRALGFRAYFTFGELPVVIIAERGILESL